MNVQIKDVEYTINEVCITAETDTHVLSYQNKKDRDFNWGTVVVVHLKSTRTFMYYLFRGDQVPYKYKDQTDAIEAKFNEIAKEGEC